MTRPTTPLVSLFHALLISLLLTVALLPRPITAQQASTAKPAASASDYSAPLVLNWKKNYQKITFKRMGKVGDEDVYVIERRNEKGTPVTDYVSTKSFLVLRRDSVIANETSGIELPQTETFSDYRNIDGVMVPFKIVSSNIANGDIVLKIVDVKLDVEIPDAVFRKPAAAATSSQR